MNHWGRPCAAMHACCCTSEPKTKVGMHAVKARGHADRELSQVHPVQKERNLNHLSSSQHHCSKYTR